MTGKAIHTEAFQAAAKKAVRAAIAEVEADGVRMTDSDMFKYTLVYTGDAWNRSEAVADRTEAVTA